MSPGSTPIRLGRQPSCPLAEQCATSITWENPRTGQIGSDSAPRGAERGCRQMTRARGAAGEKRLPPCGSAGAINVPGHQRSLLSRISGRVNQDPTEHAAQSAGSQVWLPPEQQVSPETASSQVGSAACCYLDCSGYSPSNNSCRSDSLQAARGRAASAALLSSRRSVTSRTHQAGSSTD